MANEINIQATLTLQRYSPALQGMGDLTITQTGTKCVSNVVNVTTGANSNIQIEGTTPMVYLFVKNLDGNAWSGSNYVRVTLDTGNANVVAELHAGEFCLIPIKPAAILYAKAWGVATDICYVAACA
jgi:hypothetical protein